MKREKQWKQLQQGDGQTVALLLLLVGCCCDSSQLKRWIAASDECRRLIAVNDVKWLLKVAQDKRTKHWMLRRAKKAVLEQVKGEREKIIKNESECEWPVQLNTNILNAAAFCLLITNWGREKWSAKAAGKEWKVATFTSSPSSSWASAHAMSACQSVWVWVWRKYFDRPVLTPGYLLLLVTWYLFDERRGE